jgi:hypothetical protein
MNKDNAIISSNSNPDRDQFKESKPLKQSDVESSSSVQNTKETTPKTHDNFKSTSLLSNSSNQTKNDIFAENNDPNNNDLTNSFQKQRIQTTQESSATPQSKQIKETSESNETNQYKRTIVPLVEPNAITFAYMIVEALKKLGIASSTSIIEYIENNFSNIVKNRSVSTWRNAVFTTLVDKRQNQWIHVIESKKWKLREKPNRGGNSVSSSTKKKKKKKYH